MFQYPYAIENHLGEKLIFQSVVVEDGEEKLLVENFIRPGSGPVMHVHFKQDEGLTIVRGKMAYQILGEEPQYAGPGETVEFKRGVPHRFWNVGEEELHCKGWLKPANTFVFFLSGIYTAMNKSGREQPELFDGAYLMTRYRTEYDLPEIPTFVKRVVMPATVAIGRLLGKYEHFRDAPEPVR